MDALLSLGGIVGILMLGTISPGPSFVMVARTAVAAGRAEGIAAALGMGLGGTVFTIAALVGLQALLLAVPALYLVLKLAGGLYLAYLGIRIWRGASQPLAIDSASEATRRGSVGKALLLGLGTQLSNPKAAIVYASIFATFLPHGTTLPLSLAIVALVFVIESSWYTLVALTLSAEKARQSYLRAKTWIDHLTGGVMVLLGIKLASSAHVG